MIRPAALTRCRQGTALLLVLGVIVLLLALVQVGLEVRLGMVRQNVLAVAQTQDTLLLSDADDVVAQWCQTKAKSMVLPPEDWEKSTLILDRSWKHQGIEASMQIRLWDACAGIPPDMLVRGNPLAGSLPDGWGIWLGKIVSPCRVDALETTRLLPGWQCFPTSGGTTGKTLATGLAVHGRGKVNINTASLALIAAIARQAGIAMDLKSLAENRRAGKTTAMLSAGGSSPTAGSLVLTGESDTWQALITIKHGKRTVSWWTVYRRGPTENETLTVARPGSDITILQRHAVSYSHAQAL